MAKRFAPITRCLKPIKAIPIPRKPLDKSYQIPYINNMSEDNNNTIEKVTLYTLNRLNDCYIRWLFSASGHERIILHFINSVMENMALPTFKEVTILSPFNLAKYKQGKSSVVDVRCITESGEVVIIEIQLQGSFTFIKRALYYWATDYSNALNEGDKYSQLPDVISINVLNFNIFNNINDFHTCYVLKEIKHNNILTSACQLHFIELPKYVESIQANSKKFTLWLKFFKGVDMSVLKTEDSVFEKVGTATDKFIDKASFLDTYCKQEAEKYFLRCYIEDEKVAERLNIAKNLKNAGLDIKLISENTGLSIEEIEKL